MTVDLSLEAILAISSAVGALILALIAAITMAARALTKVVETNLKLNDELQETSKDRRNWDKERSVLSVSVSDLTAEIKTIRDDCAMRERTMSAKVTAIELRAESREKEMNAEINRLNEKITELETEVARLEHALEVERDLRRADLAAFQRQINEKNTQIAELKTERDLLQRRVTKLETAMNGKLDKPVTDDVTRSAQTVVDQSKSIPATGEPNKEQ